MTEQKPALLDDLKEIARRAFYWTSFHPDERGNQIVKDYSEELENDLNSIPEDQRERFTLNYRKHLTAWLHAHSNCASAMITGPANFPVERMKKRNATEQKRYNDFRQWRDKALKAIYKVIRNNRTPEQVLTEKWAIVSKSINDSAQVIINIDTGVDKTYSRTLFVNSIVRVIKCNAENGETEIVKRCLDLVRILNTKGPKPIVTTKHGIWELAEKATIASEQKADLAVKENDEITINGITIVNNYQADRVQILFPGKPEQAVISQLKASGWHWSPFNKCWQRKLTSNAIGSAKQIVNTIKA